MSTKKQKRSQLHRKLTSVLGLSPFDDNNSASRKQMFASHIGQTLVVENPTPRYIQTGMEREYGKYTFSVKMPVTATILKVIERYPRTMDVNRIAENPETLVIYEDYDTRVVGCISLTDYYSNHPYFGFRYKRKPTLKKLRIGEVVEKGTVLLDSPSIDDFGNYCYGVECNVAFMTHPAVSEDGVVISRDKLADFAHRTYEVRVIEWGAKQFPLNTHGTEDEYKPLPDIGDLVRPDGLLAALRDYDDDASPVEQSRRSTLKVDPIFDTLVYAAGPGGRVIDIRVMHDPESKIPDTPIGMEVQVSKYNQSRLRYYSEIYKEYERLRKSRDSHLTLTPEFHRLIVEAHSVINPSNRKNPNDPSERIAKIHRNTPLDDWRVEVVIEYVNIPDEGNKFTDTHGGKQRVKVYPSP